MSLLSNRTSGLDALIRRPRPSLWHEFSRHPGVYIAYKLYSWQNQGPVYPPQDLPVSIVCISDTHNNQPQLPEGDILIHAGDLTVSGTAEELDVAISWLSSQPHPIKIVIAGNHDLLLDAKQDATSNRTKSTIDPSRNPEKLRASLAWNGIIYLQDQNTVINCPNGRRLQVYGSPYSPRHGNWAFQYPRGEDIWHRTIPDDTDILITHGPPRGHLDLLELGCVHLLRELWRVRPRLHVFGHVHGGAGMETVRFDKSQEDYESAIIAGVGIWSVISTVWGFLGSLLRSKMSGRAGDYCTLVNASIVGGLRDDEVREAIRVVI